MTKEQAASLRVGDIVEFSNGCCYWLAKLIEKDKDGDWKVKNHGKGATGVFATTLPKYLDNINIVGHSDIP